jgi:hypothetical protein
MKRTVLLAVAIVSFALALSSAVATPNPLVTGPVPVLTSPGDPSHGYPFFSTTVSLAARDYVEEEFFFEGMASGYIVADPLSTATVAPGSATPYRTRMVVRRPRTPNNFNGTVIMEWQNVTVGYDFDALWIQSSEHLMRRGYAWIGVSASGRGCMRLEQA